MDKKSRKVARTFDFTRYAKRHVALWVAYLGWDYDGLVTQAHTENTIEEQLLKALEKTKLIENRDVCGLKRSGRTDKGVSAFNQVVSLEIRSNLHEGPGVFILSGHTLKESVSAPTELNYPLLLNRVLPDEIRIVAWAAVNEAFSARHSCKARTYKYFFPRGNLDLSKMKKAAQYFVGDHDFRNFCRLERNVSKPTQRTIISVELEETEPEDDKNSGFGMCELTVVGSAFLWRQIRCIVGIMLAVGERDEQPEIVKHLLDVEKCPKKPAYPMATDFPLCLFHCAYDEEHLRWNLDSYVISTCKRLLQKKWAEMSIKAAMVRKMLDEMGSVIPGLEVVDQTAILYPGPRPKNYVNLLSGANTDGPEDVRAKQQRKRKFTKEQNGK